MTEEKTAQKAILREKYIVFSDLGPFWNVNFLIDKGRNRQGGLTEPLQAANQKNIPDQEEPQRNTWVEEPHTHNYYIKTKHKKTFYICLVLMI
jgi:hypothetical protein